MSAPLKIWERCGNFSKRSYGNWRQSQLFSDYCTIIIITRASKYQSYLPRHAIIVYNSAICILCPIRGKYNNYSLSTQPLCMAVQRRQSGSKSGGRECGRRNFRLQPKKFLIFRKNLRFSRQKFWQPFLVVILKSCLFSQNIHIFTFYTCILSFFFSFL